MTDTVIVLKRDPHVAIAVAAAEGRGVRLTADEVYYLSQDGAIMTRANNIIDQIEDCCDYPEGFEVKR